MAETFSIERRKVMRMLGAKVVLTPAAQGGRGMVEKAKELAEKNNWFQVACPNKKKKKEERRKGERK